MHPLSSAVNALGGMATVVMMTGPTIAAALEGTVTTVAGRVDVASDGSLDDPPFGALRRCVRDETADVDANIFLVTDYTENAIWRIDLASGTWSKMGPFGEFSCSGLAFVSDESGNNDADLYCTSTFEPVIRVLTLDGDNPTSAPVVAGDPNIFSPVDGPIDDIAAFFDVHGIARLGSPDSSTLLVVDKGVHALRVLDIASGLLTTVANTGYAAGYADGPGVLARFNAPTDLACTSTAPSDPTDAEDDSTTLATCYVADEQNHAIRRVTFRGQTLKDAEITVDTVAGNPDRSGFLLDGPGLTTAFFFNPRGVFLDESAEVLYVADSLNNAIRAVDISADGDFMVRTVAAAALGERLEDSGSTAVVVEGMTEPSDCELLPDGRLLVVDRRRLLAVTLGAAEGVNEDSEGFEILSTPLVGTETDGPADEARFSLPWGVEVDANDNIVVADTLHGLIRGLDLSNPDTTTRTVQTLLEDLVEPSVTWFDRTSDKIYITDSVNHRILSATYTPRDQSTDTSTDEFDEIATITDVRVLVGPEDTSADILYGYEEAEAGSGTDARFFWITALAGDSKRQLLYAADTVNDRVRAIDIATGRTWTIAGLSGAGAPDVEVGETLPKDGQFPMDKPIALEVSADGMVFWADKWNRRVYRYDPTTTEITYLVGGDDIGFVADLHYDAQRGGLWITEIQWSTVRFLSLHDLSCTQVAGGLPTDNDGAGVQGNKDGTGAEALLNGPHGVALTKEGSLVIADQGNALIKTISLSDGGFATACTTDADCTESQSADSVSAMTCVQRPVYPGHASTDAEATANGVITRPRFCAPALLAGQAGCGETWACESGLDCSDQVCVDPATVSGSSDSDSDTGLIVGVTVGVVATVALVVGAIIYGRHRRHHRATRSRPAGSGTGLIPSGEPSATATEEGGDTDSQPDSSNDDDMTSPRVTIIGDDGLDHESSKKDGDDVGGLYTHPRYPLPGPGT
eukprot:Clim_evm127s109 gene=Clim_evmTU127s109